MTEPMMNDSFRNELAAAYSDMLDTASLHDNDPGTNGDNDSGIPHVPLEWSDPIGGVVSVSFAFPGLVGDYPYIGLWKDGVFKQKMRVNINRTAPTDVVVQITHSIEERIENQP